MSTLFKRPLLLSTAFLLGMISAGVNAQTYDFTFNGSNGTASLEFTVTSNTIDNVTGSVNGFGSGIDGAITFLQAGSLKNVGFMGSDNVFSTSAPYLTNRGIAFTTNSGANSFILNSYLPYSYQMAETTGGSGTLSYGTLTGAPEIDGSLAPKVGFLLGCLFLMFGRKRQNSEPMMTA